MAAESLSVSSDNADPRGFVESLAATPEVGEAIDGESQHGD